MATQAFFTKTNRHDDTVMLRHREHMRQENENNEGSENMENNDESIEMRETVSPAKETLNKPVKAVADWQEAEGIVKMPGTPPTHVKWKDKTFLLKGDIIRLGRSSHNEIMIDERGVSRFHGQIRRDKDKLVLEDLGSTNGTTIAGEQLHGSHELSVGDVVYLCDERLIFLGGE